MPQKLSDTIPTGRYVTPRLLRAELSVPAHALGGPVHIVLILEDGYELEVPAKPAERDQFFQALNSARQSEQS
jgi:hypothetical protein